MIFTVEPMINMGVWKHKIWKDGWTAVTADLRRSAKFEHTVLVTERGVDILTMPEPNDNRQCAEDGAEYMDDVKKQGEL